MHCLEFLERKQQKSKSTKSELPGIIRSLRRLTNKHYTEAVEDHFVCMLQTILSFFWLYKRNKQRARLLTCWDTMEYLTIQFQSDETMYRCILWSCAFGMSGRPSLSRLISLAQGGIKY